MTYSFPLMEKKALVLPEFSPHSRERLKSVEYIWKYSDIKK